MSKSEMTREPVEHEPRDRDTSDCADPGKRLPARGDLSALQRTAGNAAVARLLRAGTESGVSAGGSGREMANPGAVTPAEAVAVVSRAMQALRGRIEVARDLHADLLALAADSWVSHLIPGKLPEMSLWNDPIAKLLRVSESLQVGRVEEAQAQLDEAREAYLKARRELDDRREGIIDNAGAEVEALEVVVKASKIAIVTMATGGVGGLAVVEAATAVGGGALGAVTGAAVVGGTAGVYEVALEGSRQGVESLSGMRKEVGWAEVFARGGKEAAEQAVDFLIGKFVGASVERWLLVRFGGSAGLTKLAQETGVAEEELLEIFKPAVPKWLLEKPVDTVLKQAALRLGATLFAHGKPEDACDDMLEEAWHGGLEELWSKFVKESIERAKLGAPEG